METPDVIFFIGRSGAGKGTQAKVLAERLDFFYWEMGAVLREEAKENTPLGKSINDAVTQGFFLGDEYILPVVESRIEQVPTGKGVVFDGTPRRLSQAHYLVGLLHGLGRTNMVTLFLDVPREDAVERLLKRGRPDDTAEVIRHRLDQFDQETTPILDYLQTTTKFYRIDGRSAIPEVTTTIHQLLGIA